MRKWFLLGAVALALAACGKREERPPPPSDRAAAAPAAPGLDLAAMDKIVKPGADFYSYANGAWLKAAVIPENRSSYGTYAALAERREAALLALLEAGASAPAGAEARKAADYFLSYLDVSSIDAKGLAPLAGDLAFIRGLKTPADLMGAFGRPDLLAAAPFSLAIEIDVRRPDAYGLYLEQSGLGLSDRDFYLDERFADRRAKYQAYIAEMFSLAGESAAAERAAAVFALEEKIADAHWETAKRRNRDLAYNPKSRAALMALAPAGWDAFFAAAGAPAASDVILREDDAVEKLARLVASESMDAWRDYLIFHLLHAQADVLPQKFDAARAAFLGAAEIAPPQAKDRRARAVLAVDRDLGGLLGDLYADKILTRETVAAAGALTAGLRAALEDRLKSVPWMSERAKAAAQEKLARLAFRIGRPDKRQDYAALDIVKGDAYGNLKRARAFERLSAMRRLGAPPDPSAWPLTPQTADIVYDPGSNAVFIPAAMLNPPYFDLQADNAVNYGAIGAVIAHEMSHAFDAHGRRTDGDGLARDWWTAEDAEGFASRAAKLKAQLAAFEAAPGLRLNPDLLIGETAADIGGLALAYQAYRGSLKGSEPPPRDGLTGDQRFFIAWAQVWKRKVRDEQMRAEIAASPLPPAAVRVNAAVRNSDAFRQAFGVAENDALNLPPAERVAIW